MLENVTIRAAMTDSRLAYQYTDAFSLPRSSLLNPLRARRHFDLLPTERPLVTVECCHRECVAHSPRFSLTLGKGETGWLVGSNGPSVRVLGLGVKLPSGLNGVCRAKVWA